LTVVIDSSRVTVPLCASCDYDLFLSGRLSAVT